MTSTSVQIRAVTGRRDLKQFVGFPYRFYREPAYWANGTPPAEWVAPLRVDQHAVLNPKKNPFFEHGRIQCFLAEDENGRIVGRIAGIYNGMHLKKYADGNGFFGFFECIEDYAVAQALLDATSAWLREQGLTGMRGPTNPSMNDTSGLLVDGFDRIPSLLMPYNPPYYEGFLTRYGFSRAMTMWAYEITHETRKVERLERGVNLLKRRYPELSVRTLDMSRFDDEAQLVLEIYNDAWSENWGHVPMTENEFAHLVSDLKLIIDPNVVYFVEKGDETVGFLIGLPDLNLALHQIPDGRLFPFGLIKLLLAKRKIRMMRVPLMGIRKVYQGKGYDALLYHAVTTHGVDEAGYLGAEMSWLLDSNRPMVQAAQRIGGYMTKEYAMFEVGV